jgi:protein phosphatase 1 regulatory subunit 36
MKQEREEDRMSVPNGIFTFIDSQCFRGFLAALLEYCRELFRLENKQAVLDAEAKQRGFTTPAVLPSEKKKLNEKAKVMANAYSWIVFHKRSISDKAMNECHSYMQFKSKILANQKQD